MTKFGNFREFLFWGYFFNPKRIYERIFLFKIASPPPEVVVHVKKLCKEVR
jgi:hypothetical protein